MEERLEKVERAVVALSNTLKVMDAATVLAIHSLIETNNLKELNLTEETLKETVGKEVNTAFHYLAKLHGQSDKSKSS